jgi:hypothetical protein
MKEFYLKKQKETIGNSITTNANTIKFSTWAYLSIITKYVDSIKPQTSTSTSASKIQEKQPLLTDKDLITITETTAKEIISNFLPGNLVKIEKNVLWSISISWDAYLAVNSKITYNSKEYSKFYVNEYTYLNLKRSVWLGYKDFFFYVKSGDGEFNFPIITFISGYDKNNDFQTSLINSIIQKGNSTVLLSLLSTTDIKNANKWYFSDVIQKWILVKLFQIADWKKKLDNYDKETWIELLNQGTANDLIRNLF